MPKLLIKEAAERKGMSLAQLHAAVVTLQAQRPRDSNESVALGTMRRYWYGTRDGSANGKPLRLVDVVLLRDVAQVLGVSAGTLVDYGVDVPGQPMPAFA